MSVTDLIDTTEMYLRTILELEEEGQVPMRARISERLNHSGPTVSQTIARMERDGLVIVSDDRHLELTDSGRVDAIGVMRKHRLAERLLADIIGLEWEFVHEEACRWEHVISEQVERKILAILDQPNLSPFGNPIPGLAALGYEQNESFIDGVVSVTDLPPLSLPGASFVLKRIGEPLQVDSNLLLQLKNLRLIPGATVNIEHAEGEYLVIADSNGEGLKLKADLAMHLFVEA
jgi:DtxR family Mn-dependent transcriptional regulator